MLRYNLGNRPALILFDQTSLGLGKLFPATESLVNDIPAGDGNTAKPFLQCGGFCLALIVLRALRTLS